VVAQQLAFFRIAFSPVTTGRPLGLDGCLTIWVEP
jgi:hypothetical protein